MAGGLPTSPPVRAEPFPVERFGLYVAVDDLERSAAFYEALFGAAPQVRANALIGFDIAGGLFAIVSRRTFRLPANQGGATRPYLKVADIDAAFERVRRIEGGRLESEAPIKEGAFAFFRLADPEGNMVEFFSVSSAR